MSSEGQLVKAIERAKAFDHKGDSYSDVYKAFELLDKLK